MKKVWQLLWQLAREHRRCRQEGMSKAEAETEAWIRCDVYEVALLGRF